MSPHDPASLPRLRRTGAPAAIGIVHFGPGAFFRAFAAIYTEDAIAAAGGDWGITAVSLQSTQARDQLEPQGGVYTSQSLHADSGDPRVIGSVRQVLVAPEDPSAVLDVMCAPGVRILSLTITEKGYCHIPATGRLNRDHPGIAHDLNSPDQPRTALGFIVTALARRRATGAGPFTVLSCDNLPSNGPLLRTLVLEFAHMRDAELAGWIADHVTFPATMVDRITPATTAQDVAELGAQTGYHDPGLVVHEPFRQWVIEDDFVAGRPAWESAGAQLVNNVEHHETMKLRCLNGTHSALAYLGSLAGYDTISEVTTDPAFAAFCRKLWRAEIVPTLTPPEGEDLPTYCGALLTRYQNPAVQHRLKQIAMDGSQKLPQRILGTIQDSLDQGRTCTGLTLAVAGWMHFVGKSDMADLKDPLAQQLHATGGKPDLMLALREVFDAGLTGHEGWRANLLAAYDDLARYGAQACIARYVEQE